MSNRLNIRLQQLKAEQRAGFIPFLMAGDPTPDACARILKDLPAAGADIIELGMPFSDPVADGPTIQAAGIRALESGMTLRKTLSLVAQFREQDTTTPIILMGYYNPIFFWGVQSFVQEAASCGVDGLIIVDVPPEESSPLLDACAGAGLALIRLIAPTSLETRLPVIMQGASGFVYYISVKGITGTHQAASNSLAPALAVIRTHTSLPVAVGFGIRTPEDVARTAQHADLVVVGSAIVKTIEDYANELPEKIAHAVQAQCRTLSAALKS